MCSPSPFFPSRRESIKAEVWIVLIVFRSRISPNLGNGPTAPCSLDEHGPQTTLMLRLYKSFKFFLLPGTLKYYNSGKFWRIFVFVSTNIKHLLSALPSCSEFYVNWKGKPIFLA